MNDGIIKGTGNSRYLKTVANFLSLYPTYQDFARAFIAGTLPIDLAGINEEGWQQFGDALNKGNLLDDVTQLLIGLSDNEATVNMALRRIVMPVGKYAVAVTVLTPGGRPLPGLTVSGITTYTGSVCITNSEGKAVGFTSSQSVTLSVSPNFIDASNLSRAASLTANQVTFVTMQLSRVSAHSRIFTSSLNTRFSPDVRDFDASAIGGGGNGARGSGLNQPITMGGGGGASGGIDNKAGILNNGQELTVYVGGAGGTSSLGPTGAGAYVRGNLGGNGNADGTGGKNPFGSNGGDGYEVNMQTGADIRNATKGEDQRGSFLYPPTQVGGAGGGCRYYSNVGNYQGGSPGGGDGLSQTWSIDESMYPKSGNLPGSGGGGAYAIIPGSESSPISKPGSGMPGIVGVVWRYK